jgi:hypothetical protein
MPLPEDGASGGLCLPRDREKVLYTNTDSFSERMAHYRSRSGRLSRREAGRSRHSARRADYRFPVGSGAQAAARGARAMAGITGRGFCITLYPDSI